MPDSPPKKNAAFIFYVSLISQANTKIAQVNPTLAAGDVKVATDDAAPANLTTLPVVDADFTKRVKVSLSAAEMNGDNVTVIFNDAAGAEWCDLTINIQTVTRQLTDLAFPTVAGRSLDVSATGEAGLDWANVGSPTTAQNLSATNIDVDQVVASVSGAVGSVTGAVGSVTGAVGSVTGAVGSVTAGVTVTTNNDKTGYGLSAAAVQAVWDALTTALITAGSIGKLIVDNLNAAISSRASQTTLDTLDDFVDTEVAAIKAVTDALPNAGALTTIQADLDDIQTRIPAALSGGNIKADVLAVNVSTAAAASLAKSAASIVRAAAIAGTLSTTQMTTDLTEVTDDHYNGRVIIWTSGVLLDQATNITDYTGATKMLTFTAVTEAPTAGDTFVIV